MLQQFLLVVVVSVTLFVAVPARSEDNKAIVRRYYAEVITKGNMAVFEDLVAAEIVVHGPGFPDLQGREAFRQSFRGFRAAFPDFHGTLEDLVAEGDRVVARWAESGTHRGDYAGIAATGKALTWTGMSIYRLANGKVTEMWVQMDDLGILRQLGAVPK